MKRDIFSRSSVGALVLSKSPADEGSSNQVVAADATIAPNPNTRFHGFASKSFTSGPHGLGPRSRRRRKLGIGQRLCLRQLCRHWGQLQFRDGFPAANGHPKGPRNRHVSPRPGISASDKCGWVSTTSTSRTGKGGWNRKSTTLVPSSCSTTARSFSPGGSTSAKGLTEPFEIRDGVEIPIGTYRFNQGAVQYMGDRSRSVSFNAGANVGGFLQRPDTLLQLSLLSCGPTGVFQFSFSTFGTMWTSPSREVNS